MENSSRRIGVKDLYLSAYLRSQGISLVDVERNGGHSIFFFEESDKSHELIEKYVRDEALVNLKPFRQNLRDLKALASGDIPLLGAKDDRGEFPLQERHSFMRKKDEAEKQRKKTTKDIA